MEILKVAEAIEQKIKLLEQGRAELNSASQRKANAIAHYERVLSRTILMLKSGEEIIYDNEVVKDVPVSVMEKVAKGICWHDKLAMDTADLLYRNIIVKLDAIKCELQGYQSIFKYSDNI